jgi:hypothetical protein
LKQNTNKLAAAMTFGVICIEIVLGATLIGLVSGWAVRELVCKAPCFEHDRILAMHGKP